MPSDKRPAGRPRNSDKYRDEIRTLNDAIARDVLEIFEKGMELVRGVEVQKPGPNGTTRVYSQPPDARMIQYFLDRLAGRATQAVEVTGEDGGPVRHAVLIYLPDNGRDDHGDPTPARPAGSVAVE